MSIGSRSIRCLAVAIVASLALGSSLQAQPTLEGAFIFGSRNLDCANPNDPNDGSYTMVHHAGNNQEAHDALAYMEDRGWGFVVQNPGSTDRNGAFQFGPFDDSPNNRNRFGDDCPEEIYDSFIGFKNFETACTGAELPCSPPEGGMFRVDVPNGVYRFVLVVGEADNPHTHRVLAENGGSGPVVNIGQHAVLVANHDQAQFDIGEARDNRLGAGVFGITGFDDKQPPPGDGVDADPVFVPYGRNGQQLEPGQPGDSAFLAVTRGYVRVHLLQGNANPGPGGANVDPETGLGDPDPNGGDIVLLEVWRVGDLPEVPSTTVVGGIFLALLALMLGAYVLK